MNILMVASMYSMGGLETHIDTMYNELKRNNNVIFAFSKYEKNNYLKDAKIYEKFNFSFNSTIEEFCEDVERLKEIIKKEKIDVIHVHPFYSLFPCIFAANIMNVKVVYTYHGRGSLNFISSINEQILYYFAIENILNRIYCVSEDAIPWFNDFKKNQAMYYPNLIDEKIYKEHKIVNNKKWALISRLDNDKINEIEKFIKMVPFLDIEGVDIYGAGNEQKRLEDLIKKLNLDKKVKIKGYTYNLYDKLDNKYNGIIGLGRVAIEALTMNYPVLLIGYGKVCGLIDKELYKELYKINFVNTDINEVNLGKLNEDLNKLNTSLEEYQFRKNMIDNFGIQKIDEYLETLKSIKLSNITLLEQVFNKLKEINNKKENFYTSYNVFAELSKLSTYSKNIDLRANINIYVELFKHKWGIDGLKDEISIIKNNEKEKQEQLKINNELLVQNQQLINELKSIYESNSWKLTKILRNIRGMFKKK